MIKIFNTKFSMESRLFIILEWTALLANTGGFLSNLIFYGLAMDTIFYGVCAICMMIIGLIEKITEKEDIATGAILLIINLVEFPVMYYLYGTGRIVYMILGVLGVLVFCGGARRMLYALLALCFDIAVIILSVIYPSDYIQVTPKSDVGATVASFAIVMVNLIMIITLIIKQYELKNQELRDLTKELKLVAIREPLTHLYNRRYLAEYLEKRMSDRDNSFSIALLDLDDFKKVNDNYGHMFGDEVLQNFASCIMTAVGEQGIAARFGGEEFMLVLDTLDESKISQIMEQIKTEFQQFSMESKGIELTFSGGVEIFCVGDRITKLFNAADEKLYNAKKQGKNKVIFK